MKKFLAVLLCGCLMMGVAAGCGTEQAETETEKETADVRKIDGYYPFSTIHYMEGVDDVEEAPASLYSGTHEDMEERKTVMFWLLMVHIFWQKM